ncbi:MAG: thioredoxin domain-containing protein [Terriglobales bacterium]
MLYAAVTVAQSAPATSDAAPPKATPTPASVPPAKTEAKTEKTSAASKTVKAESVTINMPEGMTKDQADAILNELRQIRQLLERQQNAEAQPARPAAAPASDKVKMSVGTGWYAMGRDDAPVTVVEFTDYQCPFCRRFQNDSFTQLKKDYIDTGKVRFVSRDLPLEFHPNAPAAAMAARCAGEQHKFWEMRDAMMLDTATDLGPDSILKYGQKVGLDMAAFGGCLKDKKYTTAIQKDTTDAGALGISGTPSFVIGKTAKDEIAGVRIVGAVPYTVFDSTIKDLLSSK